jgi:hypothetical protein
VTGKLGAVLAVSVALAGTAVASAATSAGTPRLAFVRGVQTESVWVSGLNGSGARRLGAAGGPVVSPNGAMVSATLDNEKGSSLVIYTVGGATHEFFNTANVIAAGIAWSPDSRYLAVQLTSTKVNEQGEGLVIVDTSNWTTTAVLNGAVQGASFDPTGTSDELVYGLAPNLQLASGDNLFEVPATGGTPTQITHDGRSLFPVWGAKGIVFDREGLRKDEAPGYQLWLLNGSTQRQLSHMKVNPLVEGLVPLAVSAGGNRLIAEFVGEDTSNAWAVQLSPFKLRQLTFKGNGVQGAGISADGSTLLVDAGAFETSQHHGVVYTTPFGGGPFTKLTDGAQPSWNR